jgi:nitroreductase
MQFSEVLRRRRMVRNFTDDPVDPLVVRRLVERARRAPSAGHAQGTAFVVLQGADETSRYWDVTLPGPRRTGFRWPGLVRAPVLVVVVVSPDAYVGRYGEPDKRTTGLGAAPEAWAVPYWHVDGGMAVMALLLGCVDVGLGACFFGLFEHEAAVLGALGVPEGWRAVGTVALGHPAPDTPGRSAGRPRRPLDDVLHLGHW